MSWTFEFPSSFNPDYARDDDGIYILYRKMETAMKALFEKKIILLCATSDKGRNETSRDVAVYPGAFGFGNRDILTIGSASSNSKRAEPAYTPVHFIFPGENVPLERDLGEQASGSSVATAIASGTVASILFMVDLVNREDTKRGGSTSIMRVVSRDKITTRMIAKAFTKLHGSPTDTADVFPFRLTERERQDILNCHAEEGRLSPGGLAVIEEMLSKLGLKG